MFKVREGNIVNSAIGITKWMIDRLRCAGGWIGIMWYDRFERLLNRKINTGTDISSRSSATMPSRL